MNAGIDCFVKWLSAQGMATGTGYRRIHIQFHGHSMVAWLAQFHAHACRECRVAVKEASCPPGGQGLVEDAIDQAAPLNRVPYVAG